MLSQTSNLEMNPHPISDHENEKMINTYNTLLTAVNFLKWCTDPVYRANGQLSFKLRVQPQFPEYDTYIIIDETGNSVLPKGKFLTPEEVYKYWVNDIINL